MWGWQGAFDFALVNSTACLDPRVNSGSRGFNRTRVKFSGFIQVSRCFHMGARRGRSVHLDPRGFTSTRVGVSGLIRESVDTRGRA